MPAPTDCANQAATAAASAPTSGNRGPKVNPLTGLSTDYLNHFTEAVMVLEMAGSVPDCLDDLRTWRPKSYVEHFAGSGFSNRQAVIAAYHSADPGVRKALDRAAETLNALVERSRDQACQQRDTTEIEAIARRSAERIRPLIARTAALINGTSEDPASQGPQAAIDAMFAR